MFKFLSKIRHLNSIKWGSLLAVVNILKQVALVPVFLTFLNAELYSLWLVSESFIMLIRTINLGQLNYSSNSININFFKKQDVNSPINSALDASYVLFFVQILIGFILSSKVIFSYVTNFDINFLIDNQFTKFFILLIITRIGNQLFSLLYLRLLEPLDMIHLRIKYDALREVIEVLVIALAVYIFKSIFILAIIIFFYNIIYFIVVKNKLNNLLKTLYYRTKFNFNKSILIIKKSIPLTLSFIFEKLYDNGLLIAISNIFNPLLVPLFATTKTISNLSMRLGIIVSEPLMPDIQKGFSKKNNSILVENFNYYWKVTFLPIFLITVFLLPSVEFIYKIWTNNKIEFQIDLLIWLIISVYFLNYSSVLTQYFRRTKFANQLIIYNLVKIISFTFSLILLNDNSIINSGIAICISEFISSILLLIIFIKIKGLTFFKKIIKPFVIVLIFSFYLFAFSLFAYSSIFYVIHILTIIFIYVYNFKSNKLFEKQSA